MVYLIDQLGLKQGMTEAELEAAEIELAKQVIRDMEDERIRLAELDRAMLEDLTRGLLAIGSGDLGEGTIEAP